MVKLFPNSCVENLILLEFILGRRIDDYESLYSDFMRIDNYASRALEFERFCTGGLTVKDAVDRLAGIGLPNDVDEVHPVRSGNYLSGDVWVDTEASVGYLYLGRFVPKDPTSGHDLALILAGDTSFSGSVLKGQVGSNAIFFDRKVFPR